MPNLYVSRTVLKSTGVLNITGTGDDARLLDHIEAASRMADAYLGRLMYSRTATLDFSGNGKARMELPDDLIAVTSLTEDEDGNATWEETWDSTDYELAPYYASPTNGNADFARPYTHVEVNRRSTGTKYAFNVRQKRFRLAGRWGWSESTTTLNAGTVNESFSATDTTLTAANASGVEPGHTILVESEQMYVSAISGNDLTVVRGVNGTTAATHASTTAISIIQHPSWLKQAVTVKAAQIYAERHGTRLLTSEGMPMVATGHKRFQDLLDPYRRLVAA